MKTQEAKQGSREAGQCPACHLTAVRAVQVHIGEQRLQDCERQLQQAHSAAQTLAAEKGDLHAQLAALEQVLSENAARNERIADLEAQVSPADTLHLRHMIE